MFRIFSLFATSSKRSSLLSSSGLPMSVIRLVLKMSTGSLVRSMFPALTTDEGFKFSKKNLPCLNRHLLPIKSNIIPLAANLHRLSLFSQQMKSKQCRSVPTIPVLEKAAETI